MGLKMSKKQRAGVTTVSKQPLISVGKRRFALANWSCFQAIFQYFSCILLLVYFYTIYMLVPKDLTGWERVRGQMNGMMHKLTRITLGFPATHCYTKHILPHKNLIQTVVKRLSKLVKVHWEKYIIFNCGFFFHLSVDNRRSTACHL